MMMHSAGDVDFYDDEGDVDHGCDGGVGDGADHDDGGVGDGDDDALVQSSRQHLVLPVNDAFHHMPAPTPILPYTSSPKVGQKECKKNRKNYAVASNIT